jgi:hemolysin activation/secretion protein
VNFDYSDEYGGVTQIVPSFTQGLDIFNATDKDFESSNPLAPARYNRANLYISRNQRLFGGLSLFFSGEIQLAGTILPPYEQFSLGGAQFGRGYESGVLEGDNGVAGLFELRYIGKLSESLSLQPYLFLDGGTVWNKGDIYNFDPHADLSSAGFGFRLYGTPKTYLSSFNFNILLGKPLKTVNGKSSPRFVMLTSMTF